MIIRCYANTKLYNLRDFARRCFQFVYVQVYDCVSNFIVLYECYLETERPMDKIKVYVFQPQVAQRLLACVNYNAWAEVCVP